MFNSISNYSFTYNFMCNLFIISFLHKGITYLLIFNINLLNDTIIKNNADYNVII
jgi:hypothetical protein